MKRRSSSPLPEPLTNWAGNLRYGTEDVRYPASVEEVQEVVRSCERLRPLGSRHSFNRIADGTGTLLSLRELHRVVSLDGEARTVTVEGGTRYGELCEHLHAQGFALHNLASLPHISIAGSCATATHGSGVRNGSLATGVAAIEFVDAAGELVTLSREKEAEEFEGAVVGLGGLGVVTRLTLDLQPTFDVSQVVYLNLPMRALERSFTEIMSSGYSVSLFTDWRNKNIGQLWIKSRIEGGPAGVPAPELHGARLATRNVHPIEGQPAENCTEQLGVRGPWHARLPHFRMGFTPSAGEELQSEYFVPIEHGHEAMMAVEGVHERISPHLYISEIRAVAADRLWMSPFHDRARVAIHFTWKPEWDAVWRLLPLVERQLAPFDPLPHWGKLFTMPPEVLHSRYPRIDDFRRLLSRYDPEGKFRNEFLSRNVYGA